MLKLTNLSKYYINDKQIVAGIRNISATFNIGEFVAITGDSGSGKTTLLNVLAGTDNYNEGNLIINSENTEFYGEEDWENYRKNLVSFIYQDYNLIENFTVKQNIEIAYKLNNPNNTNQNEEIDEIINKVGLKDCAKQKVNTLSGGQKQRVAIARALSKKTDIILADEPTCNLDKKTEMEILELLRTVSNNKLVIIVTHNIEQLEKYITREIRISNGRIKSDCELTRITKKDKFVNTRSSNEKFKIRLLLNNLKINIKSNISIINFLSIVLLFSLLLTSMLMQFTVKKYEGLMSTEMFYTLDEERIVINKENYQEFSTNEINKLKSNDEISYVVESDIILDIMFEMTIIGQNNTTDYYSNTIESNKIVITNGRMPVEKNEVIISTENGLPINNNNETEIEVRITSKFAGQKEKIVKIVGTIKDDTKHYNTIYFTKEMAKEIANEHIEKYSNISIRNPKLNIETKNKYIFVQNGQIETGNIYISKNVYYSISDDEDNKIDVIISNMYFNKIIPNLKLNYYSDEVFLNIYEVNDDSMLVFINPNDYNKLNQQTTYQLSLFVKNVKQLPQIISDLEKEYIVLYPSSINNIYNQPLKEIQDNILIILASVCIIVILFFVSLYPIKSIVKQRNYQNAIFLSLGYKRKEMLKAQIIEYISLVFFSIIVNFIFYTITNILKHTINTIKNIFIPLTNISFFHLTLVVAVFFVIYSFYFIKQVFIIKTQNINQSLKRRTYYD